MFHSSLVSHLHSFERKDIDGQTKYTGNHSKSLLKLSNYSRSFVVQYLKCDHTSYDILRHFYLADDLSSLPHLNHQFPLCFLTLKYSQLPLTDLSGFHLDECNHLYYEQSTGILTGIQASYKDFYANLRYF